MEITKVTLTFSDGSVTDFLSINDAFAAHGTPTPVFAAPDATPVVADEVPAVAPAEEVPADVPVEATPAA